MLLQPTIWAMLTGSAQYLSRNKNHHCSSSPCIIYHHCIHGNWKNSSVVPLASLLLPPQTTFSHIQYHYFIIWVTMHHIYPGMTILKGLLSWLYEPLPLPNMYATTVSEIWWSNLICTLFIQEKQSLLSFVSLLLL